MTERYAASVWQRILRGVLPGSYSDRALRERREVARRCTCPPAVGKDDCPVHGYIPIFDHKGNQLA